MRELEEIERMIANNEETHTHTLIEQEKDVKNNERKIKGVFEIENVKRKTELKTALFYTTEVLYEGNMIQFNFSAGSGKRWRVMNKLNAHTYKLSVNEEYRKFGFV